MPKVNKELFQRGHDSKEKLPDGKRIYGLFPSHHEVLVAIQEWEFEAISMTKLEIALRAILHKVINWNALKETVTEMEEDGLIRKRQMGRTIRYELTEQGQDTLREILV